ncbi:Ion-translocating oxidoreductase complex subunit G [Candidatus Erwinia haradaeae]|uniref:Ion-translocating oxidoreductase complex subunit G n=1 Tax=Candidatus Erwinia haradaeae TaxID=1922217 RepID=A0A451CZ22_9GAMM|nr:electron transport complex subunit RsxG [Candidatus Erwinia haradaeae]VFP78389.1 Ion-translocating oxidoreductase complex subunit G [Candidatus Erwinia haradaeae]
MINTIRKNGLTLAIFAAITTGFTTIIHELTYPIIQNQTILKKQHLLDQVIPPGLYNNHLQNACYFVSNPALGNNESHRLYIARMNSIPVAVAIETTAPNGYSGNIKMIIGANFEGVIYGTRVIEHHETPGLGDKIELRLSNWITSFNGKTVFDHKNNRFAIKKDGGDFDQFTGATITPRAVVNSVKKTAIYIKTLPPQLNSLPRCPEPK